VKGGKKVCSLGSSAAAWGGKKKKTEIKSQILVIRDGSTPGGTLGLSDKFQKGGTEWQHQSLGTNTNWGS